MEVDLLKALYDLLSAVGEILTMTWPGRCVLAIAIVSLVSRFTR